MFLRLGLLAAMVCTTVLALNGQVVDLTYDLENDKMPLFPNTSYRMNITNNTFTPNHTENINMSTAVGTHVQAPCRYVAGKNCITDIPVDKLRCRAVVIDFLDAGKTPNVPISLQQLKDWEKKNGAIQENSIVIINTGWSSRWSNTTAYAGANVTNNTNMYFPGLGKDAAVELVSRKISGIGIDTLSLDYGQSNASFEVHTIFAKANIYAILNVANINEIKGRNVKNTTAYVMPMKVKGAGAAPCRFFVVQNGVSRLFSKSVVPVFMALCLAVIKEI